MRKQPRPTLDNDNAMMLFYLVLSNTDLDDGDNAIA